MMMRPVPVPRPSKHARIDADGSDPPPSSPLPPQVKRERSPSPRFVERRLVTSGTKRFAPIPDDCLPSRAEYRQNRLQWVARCVKELDALNLIPERKLIRNDGLIIDWKSHVPVWSDTLKPDSLDLAATIMLAHRSNAQWHRSPTRKESSSKSVTTISTQERPTSSLSISDDVSDAKPPSKKRLLALPRPSSKRRNNPSQPVSVNSPSGQGSSTTPCPERPRSADETEREIAPHSGVAECVLPLSGISTQHSQATAPPQPPKRVYDRSIPSAAEEEMSEMTLNYLHRYVQTYEADRASLASAYASNASFAYRVHQVVQNMNEGVSSTRAVSPQDFFSGTKRTRLDIVTTLLTLPCLHSNPEGSSVAHIDYDIFCLGAELGMFVVCSMVVSTKTVVHNFILRRKEVDVEDAGVEGVWPLTATAHQILVFQT